MKILSTEAIRNIDRFTIEHDGVDSMELIRRVAEAVAAEVTSSFPTTTPVVIFAGPGNNGADALIVALRLYESGYRVQVCLFNINGNSLSQDCIQCKEELLQSGFTNLVEVINSFKFPLIPPHSLIIDGMFGSGLRSPLSGGYTSVVKDINDSGAKIISIDIPSGLFGDWNTDKGVISRNVVHADLTIGIQFPKLAFFLADNAPMIGKLKMIDIGLSKEAASLAKTRFFSIGKEDIKNMLHHRHPFSSKADFGTAYLIAGSYGMMGAALMAARGALRAGAGKVMVHSARCGFEILQSQAPEAMFSPDAHGTYITEMVPDREYEAIGVGPGIGTTEPTASALETLLKTVRTPMVLDADALNIISRVPGLAQHIAPGSILTPHAGEFDRLFGQQSSSETRILKAIEQAKEMQIVIVLKGHNTAIIWPDEKLFFNTSGTPAMATGGSGDVLTGVITALLAQGYSPRIAAVIGVYVHGLAGEMAAQVEGTYGVTAGDIAARIGQAIKTVE